MAPGLDTVARRGFLHSCSHGYGHGTAFCWPQSLCWQGCESPWLPWLCWLRCDSVVTQGSFQSHTRPRSHLGSSLDLCLPGVTWPRVWSRVTCPLWPFALTTVPLGAKWGMCSQSSITKHCHRNNRASECLPTGLFATTSFRHLC